MQTLKILKKLKDNHKAKELKIKHKEIIFQSFVENKDRYGRRKLAKYIFQEYNIDINPRTLGNYMKKLKLKHLLDKNVKQKSLKIHVLKCLI